MPLNTQWLRHGVFAGPLTYNSRPQSVSVSEIAFLRDPSGCDLSVEAA